MRQHQMISRSAAILDYGAVIPYEDDSVRDLDATSDARNAHALQMRLVQAYGAEQSSAKLPVAQRAVIIVSATCALWSIIGLTIITAIHII